MGKPAFGAYSKMPGDKGPTRCAPLPPGKAGNQVHMVGTNKHAVLRQAKSE